MAPHGPARVSAQPAKKRRRPNLHPSNPTSEIVWERDELSDDSSDSSIAGSDSPSPHSKRQPSLLSSHILRRAGGSATPRRGSRGAGPTASQAKRTFEVNELESTDENTDQDSEDDDPDWAAGYDEERGGHDYRMFLRAVLGEGATPEENAIPDGTSNALDKLLDDEDDFDFDYLRESALEPDDPFEYRDDRGVHVSRKEIVQLYSAADPTLRPRTRGAAPPPRLPPLQKLLPPAQPVHPLAQPLLQSQRTPGHQPLQPQNPPRRLGQSAQMLKPAQTPSQTEHTPNTALEPGVSMLLEKGRPRPAQTIRPHHIALLREQYLIFVHLVAAVHADASHIIASSSSLQQRPERTVPEARVALAKTTELANSLMRMRETAAKYYAMVSPYQFSHIRAVSDGTVFTGSLPTSDKSYSPPKSLFDSPGILCLPALMESCRTMLADSKPLSVLKSSLGPHLHPQISKQLTPAPVLFNFSSPLKDGEHPWTASDDQLLALTLAKHTREFGALSKDLLPHRTEEDCVVRVRYLSSRRCGDNPVKRHVTFNSTPLNKFEMRTIQHCLSTFGAGAEEKTDVWRAIQRDYLPQRDWSYLQKLWHIRETRRKQKANYRKKAKAQGNSESTNDLSQSGTPLQSSATNQTTQTIHAVQAAHS